MAEREHVDNSDEALDQGGIAAIWAPRIADPSTALMLNLLEFDPNGGAEEYGAYGREMVPILDMVGAMITLSGSVTETITGDGEWHLVLVIEQQSRQAFMDMVNSAEYAQVGELRTSALVRSELRAMDPLPAPPVATGAAPADSGDALVPPLAGLVTDALGAVGTDGPVLLHGLFELREGGEAAFDDYLAGLDPLLRNAGGWIKMAAAPDETLIGGTDRWDRMYALRFPSRRALVECFTSAGHDALEPLRAAAIAREDQRVLDPTARWR